MCPELLVTTRHGAKGQASLATLSLLFDYRTSSAVRTFERIKIHPRFELLALSMKTAESWFAVM